MFLTSKYSGYNRRGEQVAAGLFLILIEPKTDSIQFPHWSNTCSHCGRIKAEHDKPLSPEVQETSDKLHRVWKQLFLAKVDASKAGNNMEDIKDACEVIMEAQRQVTGCRYYSPSTVSYPIKAIVRHTSLKQLGHFMMGFARIHGERVTLSGAYGGDGLTRNVSDGIYANYGIELPNDLREAWNTVGGWNSAGNEAPAMRKWAMANLEALRK